jgi:hypothetical protein
MSAAPRHTRGMLRHDVELSANESKFVALVVLSCVCQKPLGPDIEDFGFCRTVWGWTETGTPLRLTEVMAFFGWDKGNAHKYSRRPLAYGFIRKNADGQFGIGARVEGKFLDEPEPKDAPLEEGEVVCTDNLPNYLAVEIRRLSKSDRRNFLLGWRQIKKTARERLAAEKKRLYELEQDELSSHCKAFALELKRRSETAADDPPESEPRLSVQTTSVQNGGEPLYNAPNASVQTTYIRKQSKAQNHSRASSSSSTSSAPVQNSTTTKPSQEELEAISQLSAAVQANGDTPDAGFLLNLFRDARKKDPSATAAEIVQIMHERAKAKKLPGLEFYRVVVLNCLPLERVMSPGPTRVRHESSPQQVRETKLRCLEVSCELFEDSGPQNVNISIWLEEFRKALDDPDITGDLRERVIRCLKRKPFESENPTKAQKAGQP